MDALIRDVRSAFATLRRNAGFTVASLLTLALGIGATTAMGNCWLSNRTYFAWTPQSRTMERIAGYAVAACLLPALRAAAVDPAVALRSE